MKLKAALILIGALALISGCARKCPPCASTTLAPSYGTGAYSAPASSFDASSASVSAPVSSQYDSGSAYRYAKK